MKLLDIVYQIIKEDKHNEFSDFERQYQRTKFIEKETPIGYTESTPIFKNPLSIKTFDKNVRAIADWNGDIYVAFNDTSIAHGNIGDTIGRPLIYDEFFKKHVLLHRIGHSNTFGLNELEAGNMFNDKGKPNGVYIKRVNDIINTAKQKNPQFNFILKYYEDIT